MEAGFQSDHGHYGVVTQAKWVAGDPVKAKLFSLGEATRAQEKASLRIHTFRCPKCGLLDSYAWAVDPLE